jgi:hypothetical protein
MVHRPYHHYSTSALRELRRDLAASHAQLEDQRADFVERAGLDAGDSRQFDVLINSLGDQIAAIDQELVTRERETTVVPSRGHRDEARGRVRVERHGPRVSQANPKPHCRAKGFGPGA